jgi:hypothetical protein
MLTEGLHCRLLALTRGDFDSVARIAQQFAKPITAFERSPSVVAWDELLSFQDEDWSWATGNPASAIKLRIAVFHMGSLPTSVGVFGIISGFSSLSSAARSYITRPFLDNQVALQVNLTTILGDPDLQPLLIGYSYEGDGVFHTVSNLSPATPLATATPGPSPTDSLHSVRFQAASALVEVDNSLNPHSSDELPIWSELAVILG